MVSWVSGEVKRDTMEYRNESCKFSSSNSFKKKYENHEFLKVK